MTRALLAVLIIGLVGAPAAAAELSAAEIRDEIVGHTLVWWEAEGWSAGDLHLAPDGRAEITVDHPRPSADSGNWTLSGDRLCTSWGRLRAGDTKCYGIERGAQGRFVTSGGNVFEIRDAGA